MGSQGRVSATRPARVAHSLQWPGRALSLKIQVESGTVLLSLRLGHCGRAAACRLWATPPASYAGHSLLTRPLSVESGEPSGRLGHATENVI
jgi:hypothetical protein